MIRVAVLPQIIIIGALICLNATFAGAQSGPATNRLFAESEIITLQLQADFQTLYSVRSSPQNPRSRYARARVLPAVLTYEENGRTVILNPTIKLRGHSSQDANECPFAKLKLDFRETETAGTLFEGQTKLNIGTHCGTDMPQSPLGRLRSGLSPHREALAYEMLMALDIAVPQVRAVYIEYHDNVQQRSLGLHQALFIENFEDMASRLGGRYLDVPYGSFSSLEETEGTSVVNAARIYFAQGLLNNYDWDLRVRRDDVTPLNRAYWNIETVLLPGRRHLFIPNDFDLSSVVSGNYYTVPKQVADIPLYFAPDVRRQVAQEFTSKKDTLLNLVRSRLHNDPEGRELIIQHINRYLDVQVPRYAQ